MSIGKRLVAIRGNRTQSEFSAALGITKSTYSNYERDKYSPDSNFLEAICKKMDVSANWLLFGIGPMQLKTEPEEEIDQEPAELKDQRVRPSEQGKRVKRSDEELARLTPYWLQEEVIDQEIADFEYLSFAIKEVSRSERADLWREVETYHTYHLVSLLYRLVKTSTPSELRVIRAFLDAWVDEKIETKEADQDE